MSDSRTRTLLPLQASGYCQQFPFKSGTRLIITTWTDSKVFLLDTTVAAKPVVLDVAFLGEGAGAHVVKVRVWFGYLLLLLKNVFAGAHCLLLSNPTAL